MDEYTEKGEITEMVNQESELMPLDFEADPDTIDIPESFSSINNDLRVSEGSRFDYFVGQIADASKSIKWKTDERFVFLGSAGMYSYVEGLREDGNALPIIEERIKGGKNDFDVGVHADVLTKTMGDFGWDDVAREKQRGFIGGGTEKVDLMARHELPSFPWQKHEIRGNQIYTLSPEEMIFEKLGALASHGADRRGENPGEVKWGFDIQVLKSCLMKEGGWSEQEVEEHLSDMWERYSEEKRYAEVPQIVENFKQNGSAREALRDVLLRRGVIKSEDDEIEEKMLETFGEQNRQVIRNLLESGNEEDFETSLRNLIDAWLGKKMSYQEVSRIASQKYKGLRLTA